MGVVTGEGRQRGDTEHVQVGRHCDSIDFCDPHTQEVSIICFL